MDILDFYQQQHFLVENYTPRKCQLSLTQSLNLHGVRGSGKTAMVLDLIQQETNRDHILYIDLEDPTLLLKPLSLTLLQDFITQKNITTLILDHYDYHAFDALPLVSYLIILSRQPLHYTKLPSMVLYPLDYEEFLAFESKSAQHNSLNHFLRSGTLPMLAKSHGTPALNFKTFFYSAFTPQEQKLLLLLAWGHTKHLTVHQLYTFAKEQFKVSKDWLYQTIGLFTQEQLLFFIEDRDQKSGKKMFLFDFAFAKYLAMGQPFNVQFDSMIALTLIKHNITLQTLGSHGYVTPNNELIVPSPFESEEGFWVKSQNKFSLYKKYGIHKVTIVTIANSYEYHIEKIHFEALPYDEWSVIDTEE